VGEACADEENGGARVLFCLGENARGRRGGRWLQLILVREIKELESGGALRCAGEESQKSLRAAAAHLGRERKLGLGFCGCPNFFYLKIVPL
jgi:hypothetical protein